MAIMDVTIALALGAGFLSFFSPCILPMIPAYITYITGVSLEEELRNKKVLAITRTLVFVLGFTIVFMMLGLSFSAIGSIFVKYRNLLYKLSGTIIILFGLNMLGSIKLNIRSINFKISKEPSKITGALLMGMAFGAGWTPCAGAILGSILLYVSTTATLYKGIYLLFIYSIGMGIPFIITAILISKFSEFVLKYEKGVVYINKIGAIILILFGILVFFNKLSIISRLLI
jgi:cytochrome c-type biogenesis protein